MISGRCPLFSKTWYSIASKQRRKNYEKGNRIGTLIVCSPEVRGGRPRIAGTGVTVRRIVEWYKLGYNPEEIADQLGHVSLAQVYAALAYYHANRDQIETDIAAEEAELQRLETKREGAADSSS
ncbi:MAG: DUF433 domain-containing protein [Candidatus Binatia bacterium]